MKGLARLISDPVFVLDLRGAVLDFNRPARVFLGEAPVLGAPVFDSDAGLRTLLEAASGTSDPVIGSLKLSHPADSPRMRVRAVVLERLPALSFAVQVVDNRDDQFVLLSRRVKELNSEIAKRTAIQARLEEALRQNAVFYRELQHRVKNHLQMMLGLFSAARRETRDAETLDHLRRLEAKLQSVFEANI